jgi:hypothetical protein
MLKPGGHCDFASGSSLAAAGLSGVVALKSAEHPHWRDAAVCMFLILTSRHIDSLVGPMLAMDAGAALTDAPGCESCGSDGRSAVAASKH